MRGSEVVADARKWDVSNSWSICLLERTSICKLLKASSSITKILCGMI